MSVKYIFEEMHKFSKKNTINKLKILGHKMVASSMFHT
jgi:hypothetical protein